MTLAFISATLMIFAKSLVDVEKINGDSNEMSYAGEHFKFFVLYLGLF